MILSLSGFIVFLIAFVVLELISRRDATVLGSPGDLFDRVLASRPARLTIVVFWWWLGWHFFVAQTVDPSGLPVR